VPLAKYTLPLDAMKTQLPVKVQVSCRSTASAIEVLVKLIVRPAPHLATVNCSVLIPVPSVAGRVKSVVASKPTAKWRAATTPGATSGQLLWALPTVQSGKPVTCLARLARADGDASAAAAAAVPQQHTAHKLGARVLLDGTGGKFSDVQLVARGVNGSRVVPRVMWRCKVKVVVEAV